MMDNADTVQQRQTTSRFNGLFWRQLMSLMLMALMPLLVVMIVEYQWGRERLLQDLEDQLQGIRKQLVKDLDHYFSSIETSLLLKSESTAQMLGHLEQSQKALPEGTSFTQSFSYQLVISQYKNQFSIYTDTYNLPGFMIADDQGQVLYAEGVSSWLLGENLFSNTLAATQLATATREALASGETQLTELEKLAKNEATPLSRMVYPVSGEDGISGVIVATLSTKKLINIFQFSGRRLGTKAYLLGADDIALYGTGLSGQPWMPLPGNIGFGKSDSGNTDFSKNDDISAQPKELSEYENYANQFVFGNVYNTTFHNLPVKVVVEMLSSEALKPISEFRNRLLVLIAITIVLTLCIAYFVAWSIVYPMQKLAKRVLKIEGDDYTPEPIISSYREITVLSENFEHLMKTTGKLLAQNKVNHWLHQEQVNLYEEINGNIDVQTVTEKTLSFFARTLDLKVSAFYVHDEFGAYRLKATYACPTAGIEDTFCLGEGLVGQVALDKESAEIRGTQGLNLRIESATGSTQPKAITAIPIVYEDATIGVLVFAQIEPLTQSQHDLLATCLKIIVMALHSAQQREQPPEHH